MHITSVTYTRLQSFGNYENEQIGGVAQVDVGETPEAALAALQVFVESQLRVVPYHEGLRKEIYTLESKKRDLERSIAGMEHRWNLAKTFFEKFGVPVETFLDAGVPF